MRKIKDLSEMTVEKYLKIIINGNEEDPDGDSIIGQFNNSIEKIGKRNQAKAIIAALGYVCRDCDFYIKAIHDFYGKEISRSDVKPYVRVNFYKKIPVFNAIKGSIRNACFQKDSDEDFGNANFCNPEGSTSDFDDKFGIITNGITPDSSLKDFFIQIWKYVKDDKKQKMQDFIREAFGTNYFD